MHAAVIPVLAQLEIISPNLTAAGQSLPRIIADLRHVSGCSGGLLFLVLCPNPNVTDGGSGLVVAALCGSSPLLLQRPPNSTLNQCASPHHTHLNLGRTSPPWSATHHITPSPTLPRRHRRAARWRRFCGGPSGGRF